ncbi:MAG TPA: hypothetical protein VGC75_00605 [Candidatus Nitrosocosmicus sp.]
MEEIIDKVKDKTFDVKNKVVDDAKDIVNMAKDSATTPTVASSSYSSEGKYAERDRGIETRKTNAPITGYREEVEEKLTIPTNIKEYQYTSDVNTNQIGQPYNYKENNEFLNPFMIGLKLWQNYYTLWMNLYNDILNSSAKMFKDYESKQ